MSLAIGMMMGVGRSMRIGEVQANARHAEDVGIDAVFVSDHLVASTPVYDSTVVLAAVAAVTRRIRIGFGSALCRYLPTW